MRVAGFRLVPLETPDPDAWAHAERLNAQCTGGKRPSAYRHRVTSRDVPPIKPVFADVPVAAIDFQSCDTFYTLLGERFSLAAVREADKARVKDRRRLRLAKIAEGIASERNPTMRTKVGNFRLQRRPRSRNRHRGTGRADREKAKNPRPPA